MNRLQIFDTTLRDGGHCRDSSLSQKDKLEIARQLSRLKVDVIEAGFPATSEEEFLCVKEIAENIRGSKVAALSRGVEKEIELTAKALEKADAARIHLYVATGKTVELGENPDTSHEIVEKIHHVVRCGKKFIDDIEFSPLDASRTEETILAGLLEAAIDAGATTVNISDTVGYSVPEQFGNLIAYLMANVKNIDRAVLSVHCHNDLGLAVANSLAAVKAGARQVECTVNGIGERAGNAALEEIVMAINSRKDYFGVETSVDIREISRTSELVSRLTGYILPQNKAVVGKNAFRQQLKIPDNNFQKTGETIQFMVPEKIGVETSGQD
jgi:2-isopropylmalate synthase